MADDSMPLAIRLCGLTNIEVLRFVRLILCLLPAEQVADLIERSREDTAGSQFSGTLPD
jgi:hypothetical protein